MCALFAATYPERTAALDHGRKLRAPDVGARLSLGVEARAAPAVHGAVPGNGVGPWALTSAGPSAAQDERVRQWWARLLRMGASPAADAGAPPDERGDRRPARAARHPRADADPPQRWRSDRSRSAAAASWPSTFRQPSSCELPGVDHVPWGDDADAIVDEIEEFLTGVRHGPEPDRVLATVLFTDIVGSTEKAATLGDRRWRDLLERTPRPRAPRARALSGPRDRHRGRRVPRHLRRPGAGRPVRERDRQRRPRARARGPRRPAHRRGRAPEATRSPGSPSTSAPASRPPRGPGEVLVSSTVKDLVAGSGLRFQDRGLQDAQGRAWASGTSSRSKRKAGAREAPLRLLRVGARPARPRTPTRRARWPRRSSTGDSGWSTAAGRSG